MREMVEEVAPTVLVVSLRDVRRYRHAGTLKLIRDAKTLTRRKPTSERVQIDSQIDAFLPHDKVAIRLDDAGHWTLREKVVFLGPNPKPLTPYHPIAARRAITSPRSRASRYSI